MKTRTYIIISAVVLLVAGAVVYLQLTGGAGNMTLSSILASSKNSGNQTELKPQGQAPEFTGITNWLNTDKPLTLSELEGKVVLVDFWTYSCINCIRTLPYVTRWYDTYRDQGLVVVGVHTPEFDFEKQTANVKAAIERHDIHYPVAQDNNYGTWRAYNNHYWPAEYLIDQDGQVVYTHFGEGNYDHTENAIRQLLNIGQSAGSENGQDLSRVKSPEMYFGTDRLQNLSLEQAPSFEARQYVLPEDMALNRFALDGTWQFTPEFAKLVEGTGIIRLHFSSGKVFMVAAAGKPVDLRISVDGKPQSSVIVQASKLYTLFDSSDYREHTVDIEILDAGLQVFTFTFG